MPEQGNGELPKVYACDEGASPPDEVYERSEALRREAEAEAEVLRDA